jgi:hypothetical protein
VAPFGEREQLSGLLVTVDQSIGGKRIVVDEGVELVDYQYSEYYIKWYSV